LDSTFCPYLRHDLWRRCEPQHDHAAKAIADKLVERIDEGFEVETRPPRDTGSAAHLYVGWCDNTKPPEGGSDQTQ
jgi:hypothetical protein